MSVCHSVHQEGHVTTTHDALGNGTYPLPPPPPRHQIWDLFPLPPPPHTHNRHGAYIWRSLETCSILFGLPPWFKCIITFGVSIIITYRIYMRQFSQNTKRFNLLCFSFSSSAALASSLLTRSMLSLFLICQLFFGKIFMFDWLLYVQIWSTHLSLLSMPWAILKSYLDLVNLHSKCCILVSTWSAVSASDGVFPICWIDLTRIRLRQDDWVTN